MALWSQFRSVYLQRQNSLDLVSSIYTLPADALVLYLRVVFSEWIEKSIGVVSSQTFLRGLQFQVQTALRRNRGSGGACPDAVLARLSWCFALLNKLITPQEIDGFHKRLVHCLTEEFKLLRPENMEGMVEESLHGILQVQGEHHRSTENISEIEDCKQNIMTEFMQLEQLVKNDLAKCTENLMASFSSFNHWDMQYLQGSRYIQLEGMQIDISEELLNEGRKILARKTSLEQKLCEISGKAAGITSLSKTYVHLYERLHVFTNRSNQLKGDDVENVGKLVENVISFLQDVLIAINYQYAINFDFTNIFKKAYDIIVTTNRLTEADLSNRSNYQFDTTNYNADLNRCICSLYETFTLVMDRHPPMVVMKGSSSRKVSFRLFNLNNAFIDGNFRVTVRLINESTVQNVRSGKILPSDSPSSGTISIADPEQSANPDKVVGKKKRKPIGDGDIGAPVVTIDGRFVQNQKCCLIEKQVKILERNGDKSESKKPDVTSKKFALLFVVEMQFGNQRKQIWATSLPMTLTAHASQNDKAWLTIAWDEALAKPNRIGFETHKTANWSQISGLLQRTFEVIVGGPLSTPHVEYLRRKAEEHLKPNFPSDLSIKDIVGNKKNKTTSYWSWFFKTTMVVKKDSHFHDAWMKNHIEGFIDYEDARNLLSRSNVEPGTFIFRFSDAEPGFLTLVFLACNKEIYKMQVMEASKQNTSLEDCADALLEKLDLKDKRGGTEVFLRVFPNTCKKEVFDKFYKEKAKKPPKSGSTVPYLTVEMLVPVPSGSENKSNNGTSNGNSDHNNDNQVSSAPGLRLDDSTAASVDEPNTIAYQSPSLEPLGFAPMEFDEWGMDAAAFFQEVLNYDINNGVFAQ